MKHTPWTQEQAEKWADEWMAIPLKGADACIPADEMFRGAFLMGIAKAAEMIEARDEEFYVREIEKWQFAWMNVTGTTEEDSQNYRERSRGIDANMRYDLARRLVEVQKMKASKSGEK